MFILHKSIWLLVAGGAVGYLLGYLRGWPGWGLILGLVFGPLGWGFVLFLPRRDARRPAAASAKEDSRDQAGGGCPRCGKRPGRSDRVCAHCGNVLIPVRYRVLDRKGGKSRNEGKSRNYGKSGEERPDPPSSDPRH